MTESSTPPLVAASLDARIAGIELGGTKCVCVLANLSGAIVEQHMVPTTQPVETLAAIEAVLDRWWANGGFSALGIASFGPVDLDPASPQYGFITATSKPFWRDTDIGLRLSRRFGVALAFDTDVNGAAIAEHRWGAATGFDDFAYVTVGTGVGIGSIVHGRPTRGIGHCEAGHIHVPRLAGDVWPGSCPFHGDCVEGLASGTAIRARIGGGDIGAIGSDDPLWDSVIDALAHLAQTLVLTTGPRRILMGGGVIKGQPHLIDRIERRLRANLNEYVVLPPAPYIIAPGLGDRAGPLGPIALAISVVAAPERDQTAGRGDASPTMAGAR